MSWSHASQLAIALLLILGSAYTFWPRKRNRRVRVWREADYSEQRARAIEWLGDDYLLAKPINRRVTI